MRLMSLLGLVAMVLLAWLLSSRRRAVPWRMVAAGIIIQWLLAAAVFQSQQWTFGGRFHGGILFAGITAFFNQVHNWVRSGSEFVFALRPGVNDGTEPLLLLTSFSFGVMPTVVFFAALTSVLYHLGIMQRVVAVMAWCMQKTLGTSGAESLAVAANVFIGQTEAPLLIRPYLSQLTHSELCTVMVGGFATISGGLMAAFAAMGISPGHLVTASLISAPAALVISKILEPETQQPLTRGTVHVQCPTTSANIIDAAAQGATDGLRLALNIIAMLIAFLALIAMCDTLLYLLGRAMAWLASSFVEIRVEDWNWSLKGLLAIVFWPLAWLSGVPSSECGTAATLLGEKTVLNEFVAYVSLSKWLPAPGMPEGAQGVLSERTVIILTYALCGFSNFGSIAIQIGGLGALVHERRAELAQLGLRAMIGGSLACMMTACIAGTLTP